MTNSTTGIGTVKLLSGTKCSYRLTVTVTDIVTNSTTEIGTVRLLSVTKCKIISLCIAGVPWFETRPQIFSEFREIKLRLSELITKLLEFERNTNWRTDRD